ncbi:MAG: DNA gyrase inhibitor YacG [Nitrospirae bacterium]|nr:DNA gyrase inhibitor YacG [Nitrospirota bacterium]
MSRPCPICKKSVEWETNPFRPFCSKRCRLTDLGNWSMGKYRIEADDKSEEETEEPDSPNPPDAEIHNG